MPGVATETHPSQSGYTCSQFYGISRNVYSAQPLLSVNNLRVTYDEPDNKTSELIPIYNLKTQYTMNDIFHREDERLKTFDNWPLEWLDKQQLAKTGMFYTGEADKVKCYFCEVEIGRWETEDEPVPEHLRWSPNCPLLRRRTTNNVPVSVEELDQLLPPPSYDICGANDAIEVRPHAYAEGTIAAPRMLPATMVSNSNNSSGSANCSTASSSTYFPEYPEYAIEAARIRSFAEWPRHMKQKPEQLAEAGFFYIGVGDRVKCFSCGGGLKDWDESDEPWEQHALWLCKCRFLKLMKGQTYIDVTIAKNKAKETGEAARESSEMEKSMDIVPEATTTLVAEGAFSATSTATATEEKPVAATNNSNCDVTPQVEAVTNCDVAPTVEKKIHATIPEEKLCKICYAGEYNTAFLPCGHVVACAKCASSVTKCPLCRKPFTDVMRVYFS